MSGVAALLQHGKHACCPASHDAVKHQDAHVRRTLLRRMAPEHKFATSARLCSEVLAGFADGALPLDSAAEVLRDALHILASKDVKVP